MSKAELLESETGIKVTDLGDEVITDHPGHMPVALSAFHARLFAEALLEASASVQDSRRSARREKLLAELRALDEEERLSARSRRP